MNVNKKAIEQYLEKSARAIDLAMYKFHFRDGGASKISEALTAYQNPDGGFGNAMEPDLRLPESTALASSVAFQFLTAIDASEDEEIVKRGIQYFTDTYDENLNGWKIVQAEADAHPHAPWWDYKRAMEGYDWGNPSAEILGYLIKYKNLVDDETLIQRISEKAVDRINEIDEPEFHELLNFQRLHTLAETKLKQSLFDPLSSLIKKAVNTNPSEWGGYVSTPLTFIHSPEDLFANLFDSELLQKNVEHVIKSIVDVNHWEPIWDWMGNYSEDWKTAKKEWSGHLTVKNLLILRNFDVL